MRGFPVATIAYYGPDNQRASKVAVGIIEEEGAEPTVLERWFSSEGDVRHDSAIEAAIVHFIAQHNARTVITSGHIIGCPHEEGVDYPDDAVCPQCPFWANRDRWSGDFIS